MGTLMALSEHIKRLLAGPEGIDVEFKRNEKGLSPEDITSFANATGGIILIGVDEKKREDNGQMYGVPVGVKGVDDTLSAIHSIVASCNPKIEVQIEQQYTDDGILILILNVPEGKAKPYWTNKGIYVTRKSGRKDAIDPLMMRDILAGTRQVQMVSIPSLLIYNDHEGTVPSALFLGYRFLYRIDFLWQQLHATEPALMSPLRDVSHPKGCDNLIASSIEAAVLLWLAELNSFHVYCDGRPSPMPMRIYVLNEIEKEAIDLFSRADIISGNPFLKTIAGIPEMSYAKSLLLPKGFNLSIERSNDAMKSPSSRIRLHGEDGEIMIDFYPINGSRGIPGNIPQSVSMPLADNKEMWSQQIMIVFESSFPIASRERPHIDYLRGWAADLLSNLKLEFDWSEYANSMPDKEVIKIQLLLQDVIRKLDAKS